jgi:glycosyltransferase involved in cell wall biosynthesis
LEVGGAERIVVSLAKGVNKSSFNPIICCLNYKGRLADEAEKAGIRVIELHKRPKIDLTIIPKLIKVIKENKIHIVHTHLWTADFWGRITAKLAGVPIIISTAHNVDHWKPKIFLFADNIFSCFTDKIIAVSNEVKEFYVKKVKINPEKIKTIYNGIDILKFNKPKSNLSELRKELGLNDKHKILGIIGRLVEQKGHIYFLKMLKIIKIRHPEIKALVVGNGQLREKLKAKTKELALSENVIFTGIRKDIPEIMGLIDILVLSSAYEGMPVVALEAMASGKPIVATAVGGNPEVVEDGKNGFLVTPYNPEALAEKVLYLLENREAAEEMGKNCFAKAEAQFSLVSMIKETENIYKDLCAQKIKKIRILFIIDDLRIGGAQRQLLELVKNINKSEFEVTLVSLSTKIIDLLRELKQQRYIDIKLINHKGKFSLATILALIKLLRSIKPDIVHTYLFTASLYGRIAAKLSGIPVIISTGRSTDEFKKQSRIFIDSLLAKITTRITVNALAIKKRQVERERVKPEKIEVIYNGLDLEKFNTNHFDKNRIKESLGLFNGYPIVTTAGRISKEKDYQTFLKAAQLILKKVADVNFVIVGEGKLRRKLEELSIDLGLKDKLIFAGKREDIAEIMKVTDIFVSTSLYEGCSNVILEAMASSLPVIATRVGGNPELVIDNATGILVESGNPQQVAEATLRLLGNFTLRKEMGELARQRIKSHFLLSRMVTNTQNLYQELISNHKNGKNK